MSKILGLVLIVVAAISFVVATNAQARAQAEQAWVEWRPAVVEFSQDFSASLAAILTDFRDRFNQANSAG
jgi:hypothetical protein